MFLIQLHNFRINIVNSEHYIACISYVYNVEFQFPSVHSYHSGFSVNFPMNITDDNNLRIRILYEYVRIFTQRWVSNKRMIESRIFPRKSSRMNLFTFFADSVKGPTSITNTPYGEIWILKFSLFALPQATSAVDPQADGHNLKFLN